MNISNNQFGILDLLSVVNIILDIANYGENVTQSDIQEAIKIHIAGLGGVTNEIHQHLKEQDTKINNMDAKLDIIIKMLEDMKHES